MAFLTENEPERGVALPVIPGVYRLVARNAGPMTAHGTNTYFIYDDDGVAVLDPGPDDSAHVDDIVRVAEAPVTRIILTHGHPDHAGAATELKARTGAPIYGYAPCCFPGGLEIDVLLRDGDSVLGMEVLHTPGHAPDHICLVRPDGIMFSGDHVMAWSTTFVAVPQGNMRDFLYQLRRLIARDEHLYLPAHGPRLPEPQAYMRQALEGRLKRESEILEILGEGQVAPDDLIGRVYPKAVEPRIKRAAMRTLLAHLEKLRGDGLVVETQDGWKLTADARHQPADN